MRKLIVLTFISLDGVMQAPGGPQEDPSGGFEYGGWTFPYFDEFAGRIMADQMGQPADLLLGRKTFEIFASYWPDHEKDWPGINTVTKYVVSTTMTEHPWNNSVFLKGIADIKKLTQSQGPNLAVHGSSNLIQTLFAHDLVDELWLKIFPVTLRKGKRLFGDGTIVRSFKLLECRTSPTGVIFASYARAGEVRTGSFA